MAHDVKEDRTERAGTAPPVIHKSGRRMEAPRSPTVPSFTRILSGPVEARSNGDRMAAGQLTPIRQVRNLTEHKPLPIRDVRLHDEFRRISGPSARARGIPPKALCASACRSKMRNDEDNLDELVSGGLSPTHCNGLKM